MKKMYCPYCGEPLDNGCHCEREAVEEREQMIDDYENDPGVQYGWYQQDMIDLRRRER